MQLHEVRPTTPKKTKKRIGRGGKRGTYSGKGQKGQKARSGHKIRPALRDQLIQTPKLRGYKNKTTSTRYVTVPLSALNRIKEEVITKEVLVANSIVRASEQAKIVLKGSIDSKKTIKGVAVTASVKKAIQEAGGSIE